MVLYVLTYALTHPRRAILAGFLAFVLAEMAAIEAGLLPQVERDAQPIAAAAQNPLLWVLAGIVALALVAEVCLRLWPRWQERRAVSRRLRPYKCEHEREAA